MANEFGSDRMWGLKELPLPEPVSWLPAAPGWWVLGALLGVVLAGLVWARVRAYRRQRYRRVALARIDSMREDATALGDLPLVLRATAVAAYPRDEVASLRGAAWVAWLNEHGGRFEPADAECLDRLPYDPQASHGLAPATTSRLLSTSRAWVKGHRAQL